jgi:hypothetical protein
MRKLLILSLALSVAAVAGEKSFKVTLFQPSTVGSTELQPGEYKLDLDGSKVVIRSGKNTTEAEVKVETGDKKFNSTSVRYENGNGNYRVQEIRLGGTKTTLIFHQAASGGGTTRGAETVR